MKIVFFQASADWDGSIPSENASHLEDLTYAHSSTTITFIEEPRNESPEVASVKIFVPFSPSILRTFQVLIPCCIQIGRSVKIFLTLAKKSLAVLPLLAQIPMLISALKRNSHVNQTAVVADLPACLGKTTMYWSCSSFSAWIKSSWYFLWSGNPIPDFVLNWT